MADLLSAASLLLTVLTILYSLWYAEIAGATHSPVSQFSKNRDNAHKDARGVFLGKALPICFATIILFFAILPRSIAIMHLPLAKSLNAYDAVATIFVAVTGVLLFLGMHTLVAAIRLGSHVRKLNPKSGNYETDT